MKKQKKKSDIKSNLVLESMSSRIQFPYFKRHFYGSLQRDLTIHYVTDLKD